MLAFCNPLFFFFLNLLQQNAHLIVQLFALAFASREHNRRICSQFAARLNRGVGERKPFGELGLDTF